MNVRRNIVSFCLALALSVCTAMPNALAEVATWHLDKDHTTIGFAVKHMVVSKTQGEFLDYSGLVEMDAEAQEFKTIQATIQTKSIFTDHEKRDAHL